MNIEYSPQKCYYIHGEKLHSEVFDMMERLVLEQFKAWKNKDKSRRKPLLVTGVRQCGKTYLIKNFGETEFEEMAYFNFDGNAGLKSLFDYDFDTKRIIDELGSIIFGKVIEPGKTLVVFDEIQGTGFAKFL